MYDKIYEFALDREIGADPIMEKRTLACHVVLSDQGEFLNIEVLSKEERKNRVLCPCVPKQGEVSPICEKWKYITPRASENNQKMHQKWLVIMEAGARLSNTISTIHRFISRLEVDSAYQSEIVSQIERAGVTPNDYISFSILGQNAENTDDWKEWLREYCKYIKNNGTQLQLKRSCISGDLIVPISGTYPFMRAKQMGSGAPIFSNNHKNVSGIPCAFNSFGEDTGIACTMSQNEANIIKAGVEFLLESVNNHDDRLNIVYWYDRKDAENIIKEVIQYQDDDEDEDQEISLVSVLEDKEEKYRKKIESLLKEIATSGTDHGKYHIARYFVPAKGRFYFSDYCTGTYEELVMAISKWNNDTTIKVQTPNGERKKSIHNLYSLLFSLVNAEGANKFKKVKDETGADVNGLLKSVLMGAPISSHIMRKACNQIERDILKKQSGRTIYLQIIKSYLIRKGDKDMEKMTELGNYQGPYFRGYHCGRWLAAMTQLQWKVSGDVNATISQKYYKAMKRNPAKIFSLISNNKEYYLKKVNSAGIRIYYEKLFGEIAESIGDEIPETFSEEEQAAFDLGYAQQRMSFYKKKENEEESNS